MNHLAFPSSNLTETWWRGIILALSAAVILFTIWCLANGITIIFMHLYYFPIVLLAYRYRWKGCGLATLLGLAYLGLAIVFEPGQPDVILGAFYRFLVFVGIAAVVAFLSERLIEARNARQHSTEIRERYISLAPAIILALDRNGVITYLNENGGKILEYLPEEVIGKSWADRFLPEKDRQQVNRVFSPMIAGLVEPNRVIESTVLTRGGTRKIIRWHNTVLHDENGAITGTLGFGEDITEEKWAQDALREMQQFQENVIANANVWISVLEPDGTLLVWNDAAEAISGYKKGDVLGKNTVWKQLYPDNAYRRKVTGEIQGVIGRDEFLENFETGIQCADGTKKTIIWNTRALRNTPGVVTSYIAIGRDVTAQKSAESRAGESSRFLATMIDTLPMPIFFKDITGKYLGCNPPFAEYIGISCDNLIGKTAYDISPKDLADKYTAADLQVFDHHVPQRYETQVQYADGSRRDVIFYKAPFLNKDGSVGGLIGAFLDITDRKHMENALKESESFNRGLIESLPDYVAVYGMDGNLLYVNPASVKGLGYDADALIGTHVLSYVAKEYHETVIAKMTARRKRGDTSPYEIEMVTKNGLRRSVIVKASPIQYQNNPAMLLLLIDITERKRAEDALRESEAYIKAVMDSLPVGVAVNSVDPTVSFTYMNDNFAKFYRTTREALARPDAFWDVVYEDPVLRETMKKKVLDDCARGDPARMFWPDIPITRKGEVATFVTARNVPVPDKKIMISTVWDVTVRKRAEDALALEKQRMESLLSLSQMSQKGDAEIISEVVEDAIRLTGSTIGYLATLNGDESVMTMQYWSKYAHESCTILDKPLIYRVEDTGLWGEAVRQRKPVITNDYAAENPSKRGTPKGHVPLVRHMNVPVFEGDRIVAIAGVGNKGSEYNDGDIHQLQLLMQGWWQIVVRKRAEEALRTSEGRLNSLLHTIPDLIWLKDTDGVFRSCNTMFERFFGAREADIVGKTDYDFVDKKLADSFRENDRNAMAAGKPTSNEEWITFADDGHRALLDTIKSPVYDARGTLIGVLGIGRDITERKRAEEEIKRSVERFRMVMDSIDALVYVADMQTYELLFINKYGKDIWGEGIEGKVCWQVIQSNQSGPCPFCTNDRLVDNNGNPIDILNWEFQNTLNGRWYDCRDSAIRWLDGRLVRLEIATDITERKQIEEALHESRQLFADIISFLPDPTFVIDNDGKVLAWNRALEELSGVPAGDIIGKGDHEYSLWQYGKRRSILIDLVLHPDQDAARINYTDIHQEDNTVTARTEILVPGTGHRIPFSLVASPLIDAKGKTTGAIESMRDISRIRETEAELARINQDLEKIVKDRTRLLEDEVAQRIRAEQDVQKALSYTRSVIESNPDLVTVLDEKGIILDINATGELLTGIPKARLISTPYFGYLVDDGTLQEKFSGLIRKGTIENFVQLRRTDGHITPLSVHASVIKGMDGGKDRIIVAAHDITRQKQDEEAIRASLDEKVLLLREIHHRVKNNLQIIISLTNLQMRQTGDPGVKQIMAETQNRVRAMSLVHEKLYRSENLARIDFADYTRFLATQLFSYYGTDTQRVHLDLAMEKIMVDINAAVPLGLLMNELVSNALKHAFPDEKEGTIRISGSDTGDLITLVIQDDGIGIPADIDWKNTISLGMRLVTSLVDQVDGTITLDRTAGTTFTIMVRRKPVS